MSEERGERIIPVSIEDEMKTAYIDYSMSVIVSRALPDVRDGLKPVHRRVLFGMLELGVRSNSSFRKSARIVGDVLGKYHPHGDSSVYDTMVRMAQHWSLRYPLVDGQGNFGSVDGDSPAAMRYTEARLKKAAEELLSDLDKDTVDFSANFDDSLSEPSVLPTRIPNLLVNGSSGIAVGMATNMAPHNLSEVIEGTIAYINNKDIDIDGLMEYIKAPDFPTGGTIYGYEGVKNAFLEGKGRIVMRAKAMIQEIRENREAIIVTEIPYQVNKADMIQKKVKAAQTDKNKKLVYLYSHDKDEHHSLIESAYTKGYDVLIMDGPLSSHYISKAEQDFGVSFARVDADTIDKIIAKEENIPSKLTKEQEDFLKPIFEDISEKEKYTVQIESLSETEKPVLITQSEFMRRMKEQQAAGGGGMSMMGVMPEMYNLVINTNHPLISKLIDSKGEKQKKLAKQSLDLALLSHGMLKGKDLTDFVERSFDLI
tara:strand:+ start:3880 stop:5328 length:1449 start_codon:yes stop_codon:yes gene_type:complete